jgi:hypothetical protein
VDEITMRRATIPRVATEVSSFENCGGTRIGMASTDNLNLCANSSGQFMVGAFSMYWFRGCGYLQPTMSTAVNIKKTEDARIIEVFVAGP